MHRYKFVAHILRQNTKVSYFCCTLPCLPHPSAENMVKYKLDIAPSTCLQRSSTYLPLYAIAIFVHIVANINDSMSWEVDLQHILADS